MAPDERCVVSPLETNLEVNTSKKNTKQED